MSHLRICVVNLGIHEARLGLRVRAGRTYLCYVQFCNHPGLSLRAMAKLHGQIGPTCRCTVFALTVRYHARTMKYAHSWVNKPEGYLVMRWADERLQLEQLRRERRGP